MKKIIVYIMTILLLVLSLISILFLEGVFEREEETINDEVESRVEAYSRADNYISYTISGLDYEKDIFMVGDIKFNISKNDLYINGIFLKKIENLHYDVFLYNRRILVLFNTVDTDVEMLVYNLDTRDLDIKTKIDGRRLLIDTNLYPTNEGINLSLIDIDIYNNINYKNKKTNICNIKNESYKVGNIVEYLFDKEIGEFTSVKNISDITLSDYIGMLNAC